MIRVPAATYRIQLSLNFRFADARELVPYLSELGITDLYASPRFKPRKGSSHGYDVADPQRINSELGTEREFEELTEKLKHYSMGLLLDIVPNHMVASHENPWWTDVLENGPSSDFASYFDIDWHPATTKASFLQENRVLLPVLGDLYGNVLQKGELVLKLDEQGFFIQYYEHRFPIDPKSCEPIIQKIAAAPGGSADAGASSALSEILQAIQRLPHYTEASKQTRPSRTAGSREINQGFWKLYHSDPEVRKATDGVIRELNGSQETSTVSNELDRLLSVQPYRLAHWKLGLEEINYRRFFDVNELVGLRVEDPKVFADRHRLILQLIHDGKVTGLRVDHVDGLYDPLQYLQRLQDSISSERLYVVVEKILGERETLPEDWPVAGTTGYDFLNALNAVFVLPQGLASIERSYHRILGSAIPFADASYAGNKLVMEMLFSGEVQALAHRLGKIAAFHRTARDLPMSELTQLLIEVSACLPVYRTYINQEPPAERDMVFFDRAISLARARDMHHRLSDAAFAFLRSVLLLQPPEYAPQLLKDCLQFVMHWQQFTGPVMAKGLEDTASYVHNSLISLNDVGGDPLRESLPLGTAAFHSFNRERQLHWPSTMNATSTHDTKRGEDVRARINVLSEFPDEWEKTFLRWQRWNAPHRNQVRGQATPTPNEEELIYQTMLGAWPSNEDSVTEFRDRLKTYLVKAAREAKVHTNWITPDAEHESALGAFVDAIFADQTNDRFLRDFSKFHKKIAFYGFLNSLSQTLLKIASPGVPDFYQGEELWDFNLVDPDNRRDVDFRLRARLLDELKNKSHADLPALEKTLLKNWRDGRIKLYLTWKALNFRRSHKEIFEKGEYLPLKIAGVHKENVCGFARRFEKQWALVVVPRFLSTLAAPGKFPVGREVWGTSSIELPESAPSDWHDAFSGMALQSPAAKTTLQVADLFSRLPFSLCYSAFD